MFTLKNNDLEIQIIDPVIDQNLLGSRYCTGCYIFQIKDKNHNNLLSGPHYPGPDFDTFDGQGAPEVFSIALNDQLTEKKEDVLILGVGKVIRTSLKEPFHVRDNPIVREFCQWTVNKTANSLAMKTVQDYKNWQLVINKEITLIKKTVTSITQIKNTGEDLIPVKWFAHPFFPFPENYISCKFAMPFELVENNGYFINNQGFIEIKHEYDWKKGLFQKIVCNPKNNFSAIQYHPWADKISVEGNFVPSSIAIWANDKTFSFEPFFEAQLSTGQSQSWSIKYSF
jgi:hypothetical protein